ncbi:NADPH-dependent FMN reductase [Cohnella nanjingensis]|uniref:NAD(P)H-dependent oxidoreductase n=1 Tax=Cohnella nanjingensis TaxID=1387779 RepID=A0A7X0VHM7_9BACL|nr:NADPH-dependent FMN reductase [Cohnella nanjingensis]MBB6674305.1 NAD(P)H-dependent oxidoreductase [Cohnella nanjingensis]
MRIAIVTGANHRASASTRLARYAGRLLAESGHLVQVFDLYEHPLPIFSPEAEDVTESVVRLRQTVAGADAVLLSTPEYHGSLSGALKNALDYLGSDHFDGKLALALSASGGAVGVSALTQLQIIVRNLHGINCPEWISIGGDQRAFDEEGNPLNAAVQKRVERVLDYFVGMAERLRPLPSGATR